jgi:hypothetical protein
MRPSFTLLTNCLALTMAMPAAAGVTVAMQSDKTRSTIFVEGNKMRVETEAGADTPSNTMIYDGDAQKMLILDPEKKTYSELTPQSLKTAQERAKHSMEQAMAKMTPEQRKQMEKMMTPEQRAQMEQFMSGGKEPKASEVKEPDVKWERTGTKETVAGFPCEGFKEMKSGKLDAQGCYIPWGAGAITKDDLAPVLKIREFMTQAEMNMPAADVGGFTRLEKGPGFPGRWQKVAASGEKESAQSVTNVKRGTISPDKFRLPDGYKKVDNPALSADAPPTDKH